MRGQFYPKNTIRLKKNRENMSGEYELGKINSTVSHKYVNVEQEFTDPFE